MLSGTCSSREDNCIGVQELLGFLLATETFKEFIVGNTWLAWCDNHGVVFSVLAGGNRAMDANLLIAQLWLWIAKHDVDFENQCGTHTHTKSTLADVPTRDSLDLVVEFQAAWAGAMRHRVFQGDLVRTRCI